MNTLLRMERVYYRPSPEFLGCIGGLARAHDSDPATEEIPVVVIPDTLEGASSLRSYLEAMWSGRADKHTLIGDVMAVLFRHAPDNDEQLRLPEAA